MTETSMTLEILTKLPKKCFNMISLFVTDHLHCTWTRPICAAVSSYGPYKELSRTLYFGNGQKNVEQQHLENRQVVFAAAITDDNIQRNQQFPSTTMKEFLQLPLHSKLISRQTIISAAILA
ncbi:hypothetical protein BsWGS_10135 [Bradybaena similaris]